MQVIQAAVEAVAVDVARRRAMVAQSADSAVDLFVVRYQRSAVAEGSQVLLDNEAGGGGVAEFADLEAFSTGANRLGVVFDDVKLVLIGNLANRGHIRALAVKVYRN